MPSNPISISTSGSTPAKVLQPIYTPRSQFLIFHNSGKRWRILVCHRRSGKTVAAINEVVERAKRSKLPDAEYAYIAPQLKQAKKIAWKYLKKYAKHVIAKVPNESELSVELVNGARITIMGADDPDTIRGQYLDGVVLDEVAQIKPSVWSEVIRPLLADRRGWAVFLGTPKGKGNLLYSRKVIAAANPDKWFYLELKASETGLIGPVELQELKEDMDTAEFQQEFECSFDAALVGSYYGERIQQLATRGNVFVPTLPYDRNIAVSLSMDIGRNDACAIWFWQVVKGEIHWIDHFEESGWDAEELVEMLQMKPYNYQTWWLPHDALHKTFASRKSVFDTFKDAGVGSIRKCPDPDEGNRVIHGIDAVRKVLRRYPMKFDMANCARGVEALKSYSREWNSKQGQFNDKPKHDRWSHSADAFRGACLSIQPEDLIQSLEDAINNAPINIKVQPVFGSKLPINTTYTFDEATRDHLKKLALQRSQDRQRI